MIKFSSEDLYTEEQSIVHQNKNNIVLDKHFVKQESKETKNSKICEPDHRHIIDMSMNRYIKSAGIKSTNNLTDPYPGQPVPG
mgnify:CR=1 FL=1